jgi:hypothetical protein
MDNNYDVVEKYFDLVQQEIKKLISEDPDIKPEQVDEFNAQIFNQPEDVKMQIRTFIDDATFNDLDINKVARAIYDKFKLQVKNNVFDNTDKQDIPNPLLGERKFIKTFEQWTTDVSGDYDVDYGDPKLSDDVIEIIEYIEDNFDNIKDDILNDNKPDRISFQSSNLKTGKLKTDKLKYDKISLRVSNIKYKYPSYVVQFSYKEYPNTFYYNKDITKYEYEYLLKYFSQVYNRIREKEHSKEKQKFIDNMQEIEDKKTKEAAKKYNM